MRETYRNAIIQELISTGYFTTEEVNDIYSKLYNLVDAIAYVSQLVDTTIAARVNRTTTPSYFNKSYIANKIKEFELGKEVIVINDNQEPGYDVVSINDRLVSNVSVELVNGVLEIKVAKLNNEVLVSLSPLELVGLRSYIDDIILLGTDFQVSSGDANVISFHLAIKVDDVVLTSNNGQVVSVETGSEVLTGYIEDYIKQFNVSSFDSEFQSIKLFEYLTNIDGIIDVYIPDNDIIVYIGEVASNFTRNATSSTGYFRVIAPSDDDIKSLTYTIL